MNGETNRNLKRTAPKIKAIAFISHCLAFAHRDVSTSAQQSQALAVPTLIPYFSDTSRSTSSE